MQVDNDEGHDLSRWTGNVELSDEIEAGGITTDLKAGVIGSYYSIQKKPAAATTKTDDLGRVIPMASVEWRSPISVSTASRSGVLEPRLQLAYVGGEDKTDEIPNRDSADYRVDEANLFLLNRYQGYDYLRPGTRADVGVSALSEDALLGEISGFVGASYRLSGKPSRGLAVNDNDNLSDIVATLSVNPDIPLQVDWSGRMASDDLKLNESRTSVSGTIANLGLSVEHLQLAKPYFQNATSDLEELKLSATYNLPGGWSAKGTQVWNLSNGKTKRDSSTASLAWTGGIQNCLTVNLDYDRDVDSDRDISANDQFLLTVNFKLSWLNFAKRSFQQRQITASSSVTATRPISRRQESATPDTLSAAMNSATLSPFSRRASTRDYGTVSDRLRSRAAPPQAAQKMNPDQGELCPCQHSHHPGLGIQRVNGHPMAKPEMP